MPSSENTSTGRSKKCVCLETERLLSKVTPKTLIEYYVPTEPAIVTKGMDGKARKR